MPEDYPRVIFRSGELETKLSERSDTNAGKSAVAKRDLGRYYEMLPSLVPAFTEQEALFLCSVYNGSREIKIERVWSEVADALDDAEVQFDKQALSKRIKTLALPERSALVDAIEQYWIGSYRKSEDASKRALYRVGLVE